MPQGLPFNQSNQFNNQPEMVGPQPGAEGFAPGNYGQPSFSNGANFGGQNFDPNNQGQVNGQYYGGQVPGNQGQPFYPEPPRPQPEELVFEWRAPARPFKKRNRQYYVTVTLIVFLVSMILFFAGQFLPIAVVISAAFLAYVLSSVPPHESHIMITTYGIRFDQQLYFWEELGRFWLDEKYEQKVVNIELARFPNRISIVYDPADEADIVEILSEILLQEVPALTSFEKASKWLSAKIPLE